MQPGIDYTEVPPISTQVTLQFVNNFLLNTTQFLNKFAWAAENKLSKINSTMRKLEITLSLLEAKLNSIEGINDGAAPAPAADASGAPPAPPPPGSSSSGPSDVPPPPPPPGAPGAEAAGGLTVEKDPRYSEFFKMLRVGVPVPNIQSKMMTLGIDPSILDNPNAPSDYDPAIHGDGSRQDDSEATDDEEEDW